MAIDRGRQFDDVQWEQKAFGDPHWEDVESPDCHYCGETSHTSAEHEVSQGWRTSHWG